MRIGDGHCSEMNVRRGVCSIKCFWIRLASYDRGRDANYLDIVQVLHLTFCCMWRLKVPRGNQVKIEEARGIEEAGGRSNEKTSWRKWEGIVREAIK